MKNGFRQSMGWVHTWGGLVVGWILYFVFLTGTLGYFDTEIDRWMKPELPLETTPLHEAITIAQQRLEQQAPGAQRWFISPATNRDNPNLRIFWEMPGTDDARGKTGNEILDSATGQPVTARATGGGQTLYRMHYALHYLPVDVAYWLVGICSMFMLVAIITGVVIHKKIFKDFFTFRPRKGQRSWLDMHNLLSVTALPFHLMITYSGLIFFAFTYMPLIIAGSYGIGRDAEERFFDELFAETENTEIIGVTAPVASLHLMAAEAESHWGKNQVRCLEIHRPGDASARVHIGSQLNSPLRASPELVFDGTTGISVGEKAAFASSPRAVRDTLLGLHEGLFASSGLRWLYFLSGLLGTTMIATGSILWTVKRRAREYQKPRGPSLGFRLVERMNLGVTLGLPIGIAGYFWANRLLPVDFSARDQWEVHVMFLLLLATLLYGALRPLLRGWNELLWAAALAYGLLPLVNALTTSRHLVHSVLQGDWLFAGFDLICLVVGACFACAAVHLRDRTYTLPQMPATRSLIAESA
jgi:uncharacterized iron-regulated membrane protein